MHCLSYGKPPKRGRINQRRDSGKRIEPGKVLFCFWPPARCVSLRASSSVAHLKHFKKTFIYGGCKSNSQHKDYTKDNTWLLFGHSTYTQGKSYTHAVFLRSLVSPEKFIVVWPPILTCVKLAWVWKWAIISELQRANQGQTKWFFFTFTILITLFWTSCEHILLEEVDHLHRRRRWGHSDVLDKGFMRISV